MKASGSGAKVMRNARLVCSLAFQQVGDDPSGKADKWTHRASAPVRLREQGTAESAVVELGDYSVRGDLQLHSPDKEDKIGAEARLTLTLLDKRTGYPFTGESMCSMPHCVRSIALSA